MSFRFFREPYRLGLLNGRFARPLPSEDRIFTDVVFSSKIKSLRRKFARMPMPSFSKMAWTMGADGTRQNSQSAQNGQRPWSDNSNTGSCRFDTQL